MGLDSARYLTKTEAVRVESHEDSRLSIITSFTHKTGVIPVKKRDYLIGEIFEDVHQGFVNDYGIIVIIETERS